MRPLTKIAAAPDPQVNVGPAGWMFVAVSMSLAFAVRLILVLCTSIEPTSDFLWYYHRAVSLALGQGYVIADGTPTAFFPVGYPGFLAGVFRLFGISVAAGQMANVVLGSLTVGLFYKLCGVMLRDTWPGKTQVQRTAAIIFAFFPSQILYATLLSDSILFQFLLVSGTLLLLRTGAKNCVWAGLMFGVAALVRPYAILIPLVVLAARSPIKTWGGVIPKVVGVGMLSLLVIAPWTARNAWEFDALVFVSNNGGTNLLMGSAPGATGSYNVAALAEIDNLGLSEVDRDRKAKDLALEAIRTQPMRILRLVPAKLAYCFADDAQALRWNLKGRRTASDYSKTEFALMGASQVYYLTVLLVAGWFAVRGAVRYRRKVSPAGLALVVYIAAIGAVFFGNPRFHFPLTGFFCFYCAVQWNLWRKTGRQEANNGRLDK